MVRPLPTNASLSAARWLVGVIAGVVMSFLIATIVTQRLEGAIAGHANDIVANAMPSVRMLTNVLGDLDRIDFEIDQYAVAPADQRRGLLERVRADLREADAVVASYALLPAFPGEPVLSTPAKAQLLELDAQVDHLLSNGHDLAFTDLHRKLDTLQQSLRALVEFDATQGQRLGFEIERIRGETSWMVALLDAVSVALAIIAAILAVRQLRRSARALEVARTASEQREAELASRAEALGQFAGRVAHDILSPLSTALLSLEAVRPACEVDPSAQRANSRGIAAVNRVHTLVDGLLAFSRAGGHPSPGRSTKVAPVIADVCDDLTLQARQQRITLAVAPIPDAVVACSPGVLTSVVSNLVGNAIRYMGDAPKRRIDVRVLDAGGRWRVEVEDSGPGIPHDQQQRIFEPYVQLGNGDAGLGLGLATVDRLVRAHGGSLGVLSPAGRGSLFWFELPKMIAVPEDARAPSAGHAVTV